MEAHPAAVFLAAVTRLCLSGWRGAIQGAPEEDGYVLLAQSILKIWVELEGKREK